MWSEAREATLERLAGRRFDLLVIGAGIVGSRVAYEAARDGLSVALLDAGDFGGGTSSASSKLLHGGLRYLATGDAALVRQLQSERRELATRVAPHLVEPLPLVLAVEGSSRVRAAKLAVALPLYAALSGLHPPRPRRVAVDEAAGIVPLRSGAVTACGLVGEVLTHDARLTLATARAAARNGAATASYVRVLGLERGAAVVEDVLTGAALRVRCRAVVNAAGPAVDAVRRLERSDAPPLVRLSVGVHAVLPLAGEWRGGLALFDDAGSAIAVPWQGMLLVGATDVPHEETAGPPAADPAHLEQLLARFAAVLPREQVHPGRVVHTFAGLRVLPLGDVATARASRRHVVDVGPGGMVSIAGGKLTTHRAIAMDALRRLPQGVRPRRRGPSSEPLGRVCPPATDALLRALLDPEVAAHLRRLYGADARRVVESRAPDALERVDPRGPDIWAEVDFARDDECALTADDVLARRTTLAVRGLATPRVAEAVAARLAARGGVPVR
jgi:glycerol-3-phosphate dehydrogenase